MLFLIFTLLQNDCMHGPLSFTAIGVARILSGVHFFSQKSFLSRRPQKTVLNY